jgi:nicotinamide phosphoribosyltransferase
MIINPLTAIDFYKVGHVDQYPAGTQHVYSNFTPRSSRLAGPNVVLPDFDDRVVFFGLQGFIKWFLVDCWNKEFFEKPKDLVIVEYEEIMSRALGPGVATSDHIAALHDLGHLPIQIMALPEGSRVNIGVPMLTIVNTDPDHFWLTNYLETALSACLWKPCTVATIAYEYRRLFERYADLTGASHEGIAFQGHDFSARGLGGIHDGASAAPGHLLSFWGTDTVQAISYLFDYYHAELSVDPIGMSVPATEHSVMSMGGLKGEIETFRRLITETYPAGIVSIVSDTWDFWKVISSYTETLKPEIMAREGKVVFRPDSGDPVKIICGDPEAHMESPEYKGAVQCLWDIFGGTVNEAGFKELDPHVGLIYGDSITLERADNILKQLAEQGFASNNIVFGIGSYTYQYNTRDTFGFAMKATWGMVNDEPKVIFKDPVTDSGTKTSLRGLISVHATEFGWKAYDNVGLIEATDMQLVFQDGVIIRDETLSQIRETLKYQGRTI